MAAIAHVFTIQRAAQILGRDEGLLSDLFDQFGPEDRMLCIHDVDRSKTLAFTDDHRIINDQRNHIT